jgi:hypothetical protein
MPTCSSPEECSAKIATARTWLLAHNYKIPYDKADGMNTLSSHVV